MFCSGMMGAGGRAVLSSQSTLTVNLSGAGLMARKKVQPCRHCGKPIGFPEPRPGAIRASRPKFCSDRCRLYSKVDMSPGHGPNGDCWIYTGASHVAGYGMINKSGSKASDITTAHAYSWEVEYGPVPEGEFVLHRCDYPPCVRPDHLFLGSHQDNMDDMNAKGRWSAPLPRSEIQLIKTSDRSNAELAEAFGCTELTIWRIKTGRTHKDV